MKIWHINPYDTTPGESWRPGRAITMCKILAENGHEVTWWTSNFSHFFKRKRSNGWADVDVQRNLLIKLVPVPPYQKHISLDRLLFHGVFAWKVYSQALKEPFPDCIVLSSPSPGADYLSTKLAKRFDARLVVDVRDLWPEFFLLAFPRLARPLAPAALYPFYALRRYAFQNADAVTAVTDTYLKVALKEAPHLAVAKAQTIYFGADVGDLRDLMNRSDPSAGIQKHPGEIWAVYAGTLGSMYDIPTLLKSAHVLKQRAPMIKILIAGDGPQRQYLIDFVREHGLSNVTYLGTLPLSELARYYRLSDIALSPYHVNSTVEMPAKVYDYLAVGLPIVNSLRGELEGLIRNHAIGTQYTSGDVESLVRVLVELAQDEARRKEMAHNSFDLAMKFDRQTQYQKFLDILN